MTLPRGTSIDHPLRMAPSRHVIVGGGLAGAKAAETLRAEGFDGEIVLVGSEPLPPYERPELSKGFLLGKTERETLFVHPEGFYDEHAITLLTERTATAIDVAVRSVALDDGTRLDYGALLLATGAEPRRPPIPGIDLDGVRLLRTLGDSEALRAALQAAEHVAVVGGGWIGCEVAAAARQLDCAVTLLTGGGGPLEHVLGAELSSFYARVHRDHGVVLLEESLATIEGVDRAAAVRTDTGTMVTCDLVVLGLGVAPRTALAEAAGLTAGPDGIAVDARLATGAPSVFAAGDVALHDHPRYGPLRTEHWHNALEQGPAAARAMLGATEPYAAIPYFFSDQYDVGMEYAGHVRGGEELVVRGDLAGGEFIAFWVRDGAVQAGMNVNVWDVTDDIQALIGAETRVDAARLADPSVALPDLLG
jgi:3-phenylpropionate/trans-cinnamate dioxygenase ferredoxin reductase subunit